MSPDKHVYMANQIATFFKTMPQVDAAKGVADHINKFWEPRMRARLFEIIEAGGEGLDPVVLQAATQIRKPKPVAA